MKLVTIPCWCLLLLSLGACSGQTSHPPSGGVALETTSESTAVSGGFDTSFGTGGIVTTAVGTADKPSAMLIQEDGKIIQVGSSSVDGKKVYALVRYLPDGSLDGTFGQGGKVQVPTGASGGEVGTALLQKDGRIIVVGYSSNGTNNDITIVRFNADGSPDPAWGNPGTLLSTSDTNEVALGGAVQSDGKIIVTGSASSGSHSDLFVARLTPAGALDETFGTHGMVRMVVGVDETGTRLSIGQSVAVVADGAILVAGTVCRGSASQYNYEGTVVRLLPDGTPDTAFGSSGAVTGLPGFVTTFLSAKNGRIYLSMYQRATGLYQLFRLTREGAPDLAFGPGGYAEPVVPMDVMALAEDGEGRVIAAGQNPVLYSLMVQRLNSDGSADSMFGSGGVVSQALSVFDTAVAVAIDANGKIVVGGFTAPKAPATEFLLTRFLP